MLKVECVRKETRNGKGIDNMIKREREKVKNTIKRLYTNRQTEMENCKFHFETYDIDFFKYL